MKAMLGTPALSPRKEEWPGKVVDTHMAQEAPGRQGPVGHVVGAGVSEFKGNAGVPPTPEFAGVDDSGLGWGEEGETRQRIWHMGHQPLLCRTQGRGSSAFTPRSCSFMCRSQSLTPRRAS